MWKLAVNRRPLFIIRLLLVAGMVLIVIAVAREMMKAS